MLANPYTPRTSPHYLAGRDDEIDEVEQIMAPVIARGLPATGTVVFYGVRGIGKTSLMRALADKAEEQGFVVAWISAAKNEPLLPTIIESIKRALTRNGLVIPKEWRLKEMSIAVKLGPVGAEASGKKAENKPEEDSKIASFEHLIRDYSSLARSRDGDELGVGLLLCIDEAHVADRSELSILLNVVQNITHDHRNGPPFMLIAAGLPEIRGIFTEAATFGERTAFVPVGPLDSRESFKALATPAHDMGVQYIDDSYKMIVDAANGYPYFLQIMGYRTWNSAAPTVDNPNISKASVEQGIKRAHADIRNLFVARWNSATKQEKNFLLKMANINATEPVKRADIAKAMGRTTQSVSGLRERLINKAIISEVERGLLEFTVPGFADFLLQET
jgi:hypothetical protein